MQRLVRRGVVVDRLKPPDLLTLKQFGASDPPDQLHIIAASVIARRDVNHRGGALVRLDPDVRVGAPIRRCFHIGLHSPARREGQCVIVFVAARPVTQIRYAAEHVAELEFADQAAAMLLAALAQHIHAVVGVAGAIMARLTIRCDGCGDLPLGVGDHDAAAGPSVASASAQSRAICSACCPHTSHVGQSQPAGRTSMTSKSAIRSQPGHGHGQRCLHAGGSHSAGVTGIATSP